MLSAYLWWNPNLKIGGLKVGALSNRCNMYDEFFSHMMMSETSDNGEPKYVLQLVQRTLPSSLTTGIPTLNYSCLQNDGLSTTTPLTINRTTINAPNYNFIKKASNEYYYNTWLIAEMNPSIYETKNIDKLPIINDGKINNKLLKRYINNGLSNAQYYKILEFKILCEFLTLIEGIVHQYLSNEFSEINGINKDVNSYLDSVASERNMANKDKFYSLDTVNSIVSLTFDREFYTFSTFNNMDAIFKIVDGFVDHVITNCNPFDIISVYNIDGNLGLYDNITTEKFNPYLTKVKRKITTRVNF